MILIEIKQLFKRQLQCLDQPVKMFKELKKLFISKGHSFETTLKCLKNS